MLKHNNTTASAPERVVILGGSGFVGQALKSYLLSQNIEVLSVSSSDVDLSDSASVSTLQGMLNPEDCLIILSALTPDKGRGIDTLMKNLRMIENVSAALADQSLAQVIYCSSDAVYPLSFPVVTEDTPAAPTDLYGVMHRTREIMLESTVKSPLCIVRPTLIYGAEDSHNSYGPNRFRRQATSDQKINIGGEGEETRDHVLIDDVVKLFSLIIQHRSEGVLNIATGKSLSFLQVADQVASLFDTDVEVCPSERQVAITYREFDTTATKEAFPNFSFVDFKTGSALVHSQAK